jgi:hypothetical protein
MGGFSASIPREETVPTRRVAASAALLLTLGTAAPGVAHASSVLPVEVDATALGGLGVSITDPDAVPGDTYTIDWGDGGTSTGTTGGATHSYGWPATYTITETVADSSGDTGTGTTSFTTAGTLYDSMDPVRILDTRKGIGAAEAPVGAGDVLRLKVAGVGDIASNVSAVALNLTEVDASSGGNITAYADGTATPDVSNLNYGKSAAVANFAIIPVGSDGYIDLKNTAELSSGTVQLIADVSGYFARSPFETAPESFTPIDPARVLDTRNGTGAAKGKVAAYGSIPVNIAGYYYNSGVAFDSGDVSVHLTVTDTSGSGYLTAYSNDSASMPTASSLNFTAGQTVSNTLIVPVGGSGKIRIYNGSTGSVDIVADITGFYTQDDGPSAGLTYVPITPERIYDSRSGSPLSYDDAVEVSTTSDAQLSVDLDALALNLTATEPTASGVLTAQPSIEGVTTSSVNYGKGQTIANFTQLQADSGAYSFALLNSEAGGGTVEAIVDAFGYYAP